ncbi:MAG: 23S rRNA (pseudouridine(1915)-N(3))-methyltransferase RlmH [Clostridia bacterium]|nr:23S rRNA (pseudouridine(1915)-N(3))-methyltransferase RlmH [Clostridia bacterium]
MKINVLVVGSIKDKFYVDACNEYLKRLSKFHLVQVIEVDEEKLPKNYSDKDIQKVKEKEGLRLEKNFKGYVILLDVKKEMLSSEELATKIEKLTLSYDTITFVIGGSFGVSDYIKSKVDYAISFSKMTFPHQLFRVMLLEQIYRATTITNHITYHK